MSAVCQELMDRDDGRAGPLDGAHHDHALDAPLGSGANCLSDQGSWLLGLRWCRFIGLPGLHPRLQMHVYPEDAPDQG